MAIPKKPGKKQDEDIKKIISGSKSKIPLLKPGYCKFWLGRSYS